MKIFKNYFLFKLVRIPMIAIKSAYLHKIQDQHTDPVRMLMVEAFEAGYRRALKDGGIKLKDQQK